MSSNIIPEGFYNAVAVRVDGEDGNPLVRWGVSASEAKTKQSLVYFQIIDGPFQGKTVPWWGYWSAKTWKRTLESFRYMGFKGDDIGQLGSQEMNQRVSIDVEHNEWDGKVNARVAWVNRANSGAIKMANPMGDVEMRKFAAQMRAHAASVPEVAGEVAAPVAAPANGANSGGALSAPETDFLDPGPESTLMDDVPF